MFQTNTLLVTMDVRSLYTNIPQVEGTQIVSSAYDEFYQNNLSIPTVYIKQMFKAHSTTKLVQVDKQTFSAALRDRDGN